MTEYPQERSLGGFAIHTAGTARYGVQSHSTRVTIYQEEECEDSRAVATLASVHGARVDRGDWCRPDGMARQSTTRDQRRSALFSRLDHTGGLAYGNAAGSGRQLV